MLTLPGNWQAVLAEFAAGAGFAELLKTVEQERAEQEVFPAEEDTFRALALSGINDVKAVILGQDPYHDNGQAHGLAFSVTQGVALPPSLRHIYKELAAEYQWQALPENGDLTSWAKQGVLLLNTVLTVRAHQANSHVGLGWEKFTDEVVRLVDIHASGKVVFLLWGKPAQKKIPLIDTARHAVLCCAHPSPLSAYRGFFGSGIFRKANEILVSAGRTPVDWSSVCCKNNKDKQPELF